MIFLKWWHIPSVVSMLLFLWCLFHKEESGPYSGIGVMFTVMLALIVSGVLWLAFAVAKIMGAF